MKFYSGFSLSNDEQLFRPYLKNSQYCVAGFSYGAIKAFKHVLASKTRIDTLQLFSPAFFQSRSDKFKRMQNMYFAKDKEAYLKNFFESCFLPAQADGSVHLAAGSAEELEELLSYEWKVSELKSVQERGIAIEVYLGAEDKIIEAEKAKEFFLPYATTYMINHAGHALLTTTTKEEDE
jgi:hypothetical protein